MPGKQGYSESLNLRIRRRQDPEIPDHRNVPLSSPANEQEVADTLLVRDLRSLLLMCCDKSSTRTPWRAMPLIRRISQIFFKRYLDAMERLQTVVQAIPWGRE